MIKSKPCKGQNKAFGADACGKDTPVEKRKYGLCQTCYFNWMMENESGKIHYETQFLPKVKSITRKEANKEKQKKKVEIMTKDAYRSKVIQPMINKIARLIDYGHPCIATGNFGKENGGHYISVGANRTTALNLHNIFIQSFESNHHASGDTLKYQDGLRNIFGIDYFNYVDSLRQIPPIKFTKQDFIELKPKCREVLKVLEKDLRLRTPIERIELRNWANTQLGIYSKEFSCYQK
ncbi:recombination protein [Cellulophaga phage Nekkels_1]|uniref:Protein ninG n=1 Tax=Cellulophaga phage Nekkels_1 TaxID=2745692 RepID=A0A8E4XXV5_9CAUD|nr:NinG/ Rap DNA junction specific endonuclease [Cellulophaga phage Nekkels_1]QQO97092.1 recombination protein [Cellulophaga phage Nekkels_1]QQO97186.1 recombination protein [Cellulophaga phage Nekkels_2]